MTKKSVSLKVYHGDVRKDGTVVGGIAGLECYYVPVESVACSHAMKFISFTGSFQDVFIQTRVSFDLIFGIADELMRQREVLFRSFDKLRARLSCKRVPMAGFVRGNWKPDCFSGKPMVESANRMRKERLGEKGSRTKIVEWMEESE